MSEPLLKTGYKVKVRNKFQGRLLDYLWNGFWRVEVFVHLHRTEYWTINEMELTLLSEDEKWDVYDDATMTESPCVIAAKDADITRLKSLNDDLLAACKLVVKWMDREDGFVKADEWVVVLKAAIARAEWRAEP